MKAPKMTRPLTLSDLTSSGKLIWLYCYDCGHEQEIPPEMLPLPVSVPVPDVGKPLKCSKCGSQKISSKPQLYERPIHEIRTGR